MSHEITVKLEDGDYGRKYGATLEIRKIISSE